MSRLAIPTIDTAPEASKPLLAAALAGVTVPLALKRFGVDPAVAGGVIVTTVTDVIGFASLLGLGTRMLR